MRQFDQSMTSMLNVVNRNLSKEKVRVIAKDNDLTEMKQENERLAKLLAVHTKFEFSCIT